MKGSLPENDLDPKRTRRADRLDDSSEDEQGLPQPKRQHKQPQQQQQQPTPVTVAEDSIELRKEETATPPGGRPSQVSHRDAEERYSQTNAYSSPPLQDTQAVSTQQIEAQLALSEEVEDEVKEGVWGYLFPLDTRYGGRCLVMKKTRNCASPSEQKDHRKGKSPMPKDSKRSSGGYLIGRHPECGMYFFSFLFFPVPSFCPCRPLS